MKSIGIYIHIPFCVKKCEYCDFLSFSGKNNCFAPYLNALLNQIREFQFKNFRKEDYIVDTLFIGGGTPSILPADYIEKIMDTVRKNFALSESAEITLEANPGTVDFEKLTKYRRAGINRLSMGFQSMDTENLEKLGRIHTPEEAEKAFREARQAGFQNINVDLIFGYPWEDEDSFRTTLQKVTGLNPNHISAYSLIVEEGTPMYEKVENGTYPVPDDAKDRREYAYLLSFLNNMGYTQYEISNFTQPGFESKHNSRYWKQQEYLGFGLGASSFLEGTRFSNTENLGEYIENNGLAPYREFDRLDSDGLMDEFMMLGFRMTEGPDFEEFEKKFGVNPEIKYNERLQKLTSQGLIYRKNNGYGVTLKGLDFANLIFEEFI